MSGFQFTIVQSIQTSQLHSCPYKNELSAQRIDSQSCPPNHNNQMHNFDINNPPMQVQSLYSRLQSSFHSYYFCYPDRRPLHLHESHLSDPTLLGIRIVAFVYLTGIYIWTLITMPTLNTNIIFLTLLGYTATWLYFGLTLQDMLINRSQPFISQGLHKVVQILHEIAVCSQVPITLVFWTILFKIVLDLPNVTTSEIVLQGNLHAMPLLFLVLDFTHSTFSFPLRHVQFIVVFIVLYLIINMSYSLCVKPIYKPIPWTDFASYLISLGCIAMVLGVHFAGRLVFRRWKLGRLQEKEEVARSFLEKGERFSQIQDEGTAKENQAFRKSVDL